MITSCQTSLSGMPRRFPKIIVFRSTPAGLSEINNNPRAKNEVNTIPMLASSRIRLFALISAIAPDASNPATKAPRAKGSFSKCASATPGTTAWDKASPMRDQPFRVMKDERNPHTPPTSALTQMARSM